MGIERNTILQERFLVREKVATGGMTVVYRGLDLSSDVDVAVKVFERDEHLPDVLAESYRREVASLTNLRHPHILRIRGSGDTSDNRPFIALDWMDRDLNAERARGGTAFDGWDDFADEIAMPVLSALCFAHNRGVCHRDIKPGNILLSDDGTIRLADFNIAKLKTEFLKSHLTLNEFASRPFSAPEPESKEHSYARDVFSFGVLCVWALSDSPLRTYEDVNSALEVFDGPPEVIEVLRRALSVDPSARYETASLLEHALLPIQRARSQHWSDQSRALANLRVTQKSCQLIANILHSDPSDRAKITSFIEDDLKQGAVIERFIDKSTNLAVAGSYQVHGEQCSYHIATDRHSNDSFVVLGARSYDVSYLQHLKSNRSPLPIRFTCMRDPNARAASDIVAEIEDAFAVFASEAGAVSEEERLFAAWSRVLEARAAYARERKPPIRFGSSEVKGRWVTLSTDDDLSALELEEPRCVTDSNGFRYSGEVYEIRPGAVSLYVPHRDLADFPDKGVARLDTYAHDVAIRRQHAALDAIRTNHGSRADLRELIVDPARCQPISRPTELATDYAIDASKQDALKCALASDDFLLVQGPPGTGKTRFIAALVCESLSRNPRARILLTSQTHVAIDNALERIAEINPDLRLVRIARSGDMRVAASVEPWLIDNALGSWRTEVANRCSEALEELAENSAVNVRDLELGIRLQRLLLLNQRVVRHRTTIKEHTLRLDGLKKMPTSDGARSTMALERESIESERSDAQVALRADTEEARVLEATLSRDYPESKELLQLDHAELDSWVKDLLPDSEHAQELQQIIRWQADWLERFGHDDSFLAAMCESADVVAATCLGLASVPGTESVEFDLCIMDEAGKAHATEATVPLVPARKWVMVGDPRQLPPFEDEALKSEQYRDRFEITSDDATEPLFDRLVRLLPAENQKMLRIQYRMVKPIGDLISECFYAGELETNERTPDPDLTTVLGGNAVWISTHLLQQRMEQRARDSFVNPCEAEKVLDLLGDFEHALRDTERKVHVLCLSGYAAQVRLMEQSVVRESHLFPHLDIECRTVDAVQGREADVVVFSVTRSNTRFKAGFLGELRRINVALSRAREVLAIVGDADFVRRTEGLEALQRVFSHLQGERPGCGVQQFEATSHA